MRALKTIISALPLVLLGCVLGAGVTRGVHGSRRYLALRIADVTSTAAGTQNSSAAACMSPRSGCGSQRSLARRNA